jgi:sugar lactone lactonase YvrE
MTTPTVTVSSFAIAYGTASATLSATVAYSGVLPTGAFTFAVDSGAPVAATCNSAASPETCTLSYSTSALTVGAHTITGSLASDSNYYTSSNTGTLTVVASSYSAPTENVGTASGTQTATILFNSSFTLGSINVLTQGATGLDFQNAGTGTCTTTAYTAGQTCTVTYTFTPTYPWVRYGAITIYDNSGTPNLEATVYLTGTGTGPQAIYNPGTLSTLGGGFSHPRSVAVDSSGNVYVADDNNNAVNEIPAGCASSGCVTTLGGGFNAPTGVAVDGAGNIYVIDYFNNAVKEIPVGCASSGCVTTLGGGFSYPQDVVVDASGNVYVADTYNGLVKEMPAGCATAGCVTTLGGGFSQPVGVAVDGSGNVYISDANNHAVKEMPAGCASAGCVTTLGGGFSGPRGVAIDGSGNVYVADSGNSLVKEIPLSCINGANNSGCVTTLGSGFSSPFGLTVDAGGNVYVADSGNSAVKELNFATPPSLSFANTNVGQNSSDSPQTVTLGNDGNATLSMPTIASTSSSFLLTGTTCGNSLLAGTNCPILVTFTPQSAIALTGDVNITDNTLNVSGTLQQIPLSGTGIQATVNVTVGTSPSGLGFSIDGTPYTTAQIPTWNIGDSHTLATTSPQYDLGLDTQYTFTSWSDGTLTTTDSVTAASATTSYTANFSSQYLLSVSATTGGSATPLTTPSSFYTPTTVVPITATPSAGYYFTGWTGSADIASASSASTTITINSPETITANFAAIPSYVVTTLTDDSTSPNAANCPGPTCSLADAITAANANNGGAGSITFNSGLSGTITLTATLPTVTGLTTITGPTAASGNSITVSGANTYQVFYVASGTISISNLTIANGNASEGGGIYNNGTLTVSSSTFAGNSGDSGGGIGNGNTGTLSVNYSTFSGNTANDGGGIVNSGILTVSNSTFSGNSASGYGGGILNFGTSTVTNSIFSGNTASNSGAGIFDNIGTVNANSNVYYNNLDGGVTEDDCRFCNTNSNEITGNPDLSVLGSYGGPTQTFLPLPGSSAICSANGAFPAGTTTDQRGGPQSTTYGSTTCYDVGAVQTNYAMNFTLQQPSNTAATVAMSPAPIVTVTESGNALTAGSASISVTDADTDLTTSPATASTSASNGEATFSSLIFTSIETGDSLTASLSLNPAIPVSTTAGSGTFNVTSSAPTTATVSAVSAPYGSTTGVTVTVNESGTSGSTDGGIVTFADVSGGGSFSSPTCTLSGGTCSTSYIPSGTLAAGTYNTDITASFAAVGNYSATSASNTLTITTIAPTTATVSAVSAPYGSTTGVTVTVNESGTGGVVTGGIVTFADVSGGGSFSSPTCTLSVSGTCTTTYHPSGTLAANNYPSDITASFATVGNYSAASASNTLTITKQTPTFGTMSFSPLAAEPYGTSQAITISDTLSYTGGGSAPTGAVTYVLNSISYPASCTATGSPETCTAAVSAGTIAALPATGYTVTAGYTADTNYGTAAGTSGTFTINQATQTIVFAPVPAPVILGASPITLSATGGGSGNPVTFSILSGGAYGSLSGPNNSILTITGGGTIILAANQAGNSNYLPATTVTQTILVVAGSYSTPSQPIGQATSQQTASIQLPTGFTLGSISVLTDGVPGLDFGYQPGGSCTIGSTYTSSQICTVNYSFTPTAPGVRQGAIALYNNAATPVLEAVVYLNGIGTGPLVAFAPGLQSTVNSSLYIPSSVVVDGGGNLYIADSSNNRVVKETPSGGSYTQTIVGSGLNYPLGVAVDVLGNLYIADTYNNRILKETPSGSSYTQSTAVSGLNLPSGVAVDGTDNLYIVNGGNSVLMETLSGSSYVQSTVANNTNNGLYKTNGVAVDGNGNVYIADGGNNRVLMETPSGSSYTQTTVVDSTSPAVPPVSNPYGVTVDGVGNVYVADTYNGRILRETPSGSGYVQNIVANSANNGLGNPRDVAVDASGNLYIADNYRAVKLDVFDPPSLTFASTLVGDTSSDSPQTISVTNIGNDALTLPIPVSGNNPSITTNFTLGSGGPNPCPLVPSTASYGGVLGVGITCTLPISFVPTTTGPLTGSLVLTDNNLNGVNVAQTISLAGTGINSIATTTTLTVTPISPSNYRDSLLFTVTVTPNSGGVTPTGTVQLYVNGTPLYSPLILGTGGCGSDCVSVSDSLLNVVGSPYTITAVYTPTPGSNFIAGTPGSVTQVVTQAQQYIYLTPPPSPVTYGVPPITLSANSSSGNPVTFSVLSGPGSITGDTLTVTGVGTIVIAGNLPGNSNYLAAPQETEDVVVNGVSQTIYFTQPTSPVTYGVAPITLNATGGASGNPVTFSIVSGGAYGSLSGPNNSILTITGVGTIVIAANQAAGNNYAAAAQVTRTVVVNPETQTITFTPIATPMTYGIAPITLSATGGTSGNPVTFSVLFGPGSITGGNTLNITGAGTVGVAANQAGSSTYSAATQVQQTLVVYKATPPILLASNSNPVLLGNSITLTTTLTGPSVPTGTVTFYDGTIPLATPTINGSGVASFTTSSLSGGSHTLTAQYWGDPNFVAVSSAPLTQVVDDFSLSIPSTTSSNTTVTSQPGGTAVFNFTLSPVGSSTFLAPITLTVTGLPAGATYNFVPPTISAGAGPTPVTLTVYLPQIAMLSQPSIWPSINGSGRVMARNAGPGMQNGTGRKLAPLALALLLLPFAARMRRTRKRLGRLLCILLLITVGITTAMGLSGCSSSFDTPNNYPLTVTGTYKTVVHSTTVTLTVE